MAEEYFYDLRPQPPLSGIGKSHQPVDEPHHKKTGGLSSNFEDPDSLPQFELRKASPAPLNATAGGKSDSTVKKKKKKKKKTDEE
ncbi:hypothetical protein DPMN_076600 [Dreissena polymorpha]|uniref:Uncharacterized protein n=1 Tax=Dreissena polymorpha TaxID=45954 RepID=A0A9D4BNT5_DREPO|nr:hypothetical protein DPMN_076600 [Dreissena polymorpha]